MQDGKNKNNNNSKNNLIGLAIFVGMFILIVIVIIILTKSILPSSGSSTTSMLVADSNLGIHTDTTTEPVSITTSGNNSSQNDNDSYDDYNGSSTEQGTKMTVNSSVNVRSGPGSENKQIGEIAAGTEITVYENVGGWYRILFNGSTDAYVYSSYVDGSLPESSSDSSNAYAANAATSSSYAQYGQQNSFADITSQSDEYYYN